MYFIFSLYREPLPGNWDKDLDQFQKIIVLKCLRADKVTQAMQDYVADNLGQRFIEPQVDFAWFSWVKSVALRKAKIVYNFGFSECNRVKCAEQEKKRYISITFE